MNKYKVSITFDVVENKGQDVNNFLDEIERVITEDIDSLIPTKNWPAVKEIADPSIKIRRRL